MKADLTIEGDGFFKIDAHTISGSDWMDENLDFDPSGIEYTDSINYAQDIAEGATLDGLTVSVNGYLYLAGGGRGPAVA